MIGEYPFIAPADLSKPAPPAVAIHGSTCTPKDEKSEASVIPFTIPEGDDITRDSVAFPEDPLDLSSGAQHLILLEGLSHSYAEPLPPLGPAPPQDISAARRTRPTPKAMGPLAPDVAWLICPFWHSSL